MNDGEIDGYLYVFSLLESNDLVFFFKRCFYRLVKCVGFVIKKICF